MGTDVRFPMTSQDFLANTTECECGASIAWRTYERDGKTRRMPMHVATQIRQADGSRLLESHFAYCPLAGKFRRGANGE